MATFVVAKPGVLGGKLGASLDVFLVTKEVISKVMLKTT